MITPDNLNDKIQPKDKVAAPTDNHATAADPQTNPWSAIACQNLTGAFKKFDNTVPSQFPDIKGFESRATECSAQLTPQQNIDLYNAVYERQPLFSKYEGTNIQPLANVTEYMYENNYPTHLMADSWTRARSIATYPHNPVAASLEEKLHTNGNLTDSENHELSGARFFRNNPYAANLEAKKLSGPLTNDEQDALNTQKLDPAPGFEDLKRNDVIPHKQSASVINPTRLNSPRTFDI